MKLEFEFFQGLMLLLGFIGVLFTAGRLLLTQIDRRLEERFKAQEAARAQAGEHWNERFAELMKQSQREADRWSSLEREFLRFQADLPLNYVRREDYVRGQTILESKMDGLALKLEQAQLRANQGEKNA